MPQAGQLVGAALGVALVMVAAQLLVPFDRRVELVFEKPYQPEYRGRGAFQALHQVGTRDGRAPPAQDVVKLIDAVELVQLHVRAVFC
jgi:hypothetical protein